MKSEYISEGEYLVASIGNIIVINGAFTTSSKQIGDGFVIQTGLPTNLARSPIVIIQKINGALVWYDCWIVANNLFASQLPKNTQMRFTAVYIGRN